MTKIEDFLENDLKQIDLELRSLNYYEDLLKEFGYEMEDLSGLNLNGWQVDFRYWFENPEGKRLRLSGSLWYGDYQLKKEI